MFMKAIVVVKEGIVDNIEVVSGNDESMINARAEEIFLETCAEQFSNWSDYTVEDIDKVVENGFEKGNDVSVNLVNVFP